MDDLEYSYLSGTMETTFLSPLNRSDVSPILRVNMEIMCKSAITGAIIGFEIFVILFVSFVCRDGLTLNLLLEFFEAIPAFYK